MLVALSLAGCARFGAFESGDGDVTGSIAPAKSPASAELQGVDPSDWTAVRTKLADAGVGANVELEWQNPRTRSAGTITTLAAPGLKGGATCQPFATTVNDMRGIRRYRGEACHTGAGAWRLTDVVADDSALL